MAFRTNGKIIAAKSSFAIVATGATCSSSRCVMIEGKRRSDLPALGHSRPNAMTLIAIDFLCRSVLCMTESNPECRRLRTGSRIATELMARAAGRNVAAIRLSLRSVALVTSSVCVQARRY
jgi:hypothetical protein